ncbi:hypothetical protein BH10PLA1_BH10PLA1_05320 [soil metagenome]
MTSRSTILIKTLAAPILCLALLGAIAAEQRHHAPPPNVAGYHASVKAMIESEQYFPHFIGRWAGKDKPVDIEAQNLLRPNAIVSREYTDNDTGDLSRKPRVANILLDQCSDSSDMDGHWPPRCYPAKGDKLDSQRDREFTLNGVSIPVVEYMFISLEDNRQVKLCIYNFLIVPNRGIKREMQDVRDAAADYRQRFYGAAQIQVIVDGDLSQSERDAIFSELITPITPVIQAILNGGHQ